MIFLISKLNFSITCFVKIFQSKLGNLLLYYNKSIAMRKVMLRLIEIVFAQHTLEMSFVTTKFGKRYYYFLIDY